MEGVAKVGETLIAKVTPEKATVNYQWMRSDSEDKDGTYTNITGATSSTYKLVADDVGKWIKVKATGTGNYKGTVESKAVGPVEKAEEEPVVPETASFVAKNSFGINDNKVYAGYELQDGDGNQIPLTENNIESITVLEPGAEEPKNLTVVGNEDPLLWFNIAKEAGTYTYTVVTKGEDSKAYEATIEWTAPAEATVNFQAPADAEAAFDEANATVDFSKVSADELLDWTSVKAGYYAIELKIEGVDLSEDNVKYAFRVYGDGTAIAPEIKGDLDCQYVTTDWKTGTATMYYVVGDDYSLHQAKINVVNLTPKTALPAQSTYKLTHTGLAESYTVGELITGSTQAQINASVEAAIEGIAPVQVTLATDVLGKTGYDAVRITPVEAGNNIQLWAKDTANNWYDINVTGWGPPGGFALPAQYNVTTDIYVLSNAAGDYTLNIKLVNASDNAVIAEASGTVKVSTVQVSDENGLNAALDDNNVKTIKFAKDITLTQQVNIARDIVIDGQGKNLTGTDSLRAFMVQGEGIDVTIQNINFATFTQGTTVNSVGTIAIKNNTYTNVYRCMDFGSGLTSENVTITGNTFNLSEGNRAVSYPVKATKDDINSILKNDNTFTGSIADPDYLIKYYSGKYHYHLANQPIIDFEVTVGEIPIKVENKETGDHDNLGTITVTGAIEDGALIAALEAQKSDFVDVITLQEGKAYIESFDGKNTCYYLIINSNGDGGEGA